MSPERNRSSELKRVPIVTSDQEVLSQAGTVFDISVAGLSGANSLPAAVMDKSELPVSNGAGANKPENELIYPYVTVTGREVLSPRKERTPKKRTQIFRTGVRIKKMTAGIRKSNIGIIHETFSDVSAIAKPLTQRTFSTDQVHRLQTPFIARAMQEREVREDIIRSIDAETTDRSVQIKMEILRGGYYVPAVVVGSGFSEMILSTEFSRRLPQGSVMSIDRADHLGGQFGNNGGRRPTFNINSRTRPEDRRFANLPGEQGNIISLGKNAPLQLPDFANTTFPTNLDLSDAIAVNQYLAGQDYLLGVKVSGWRRNRTSDQGTYSLFLRDGASDQGFSLSTDAVIFASGIGDPRPGVNLKDPETNEIFEASQRQLEEGSSVAPVMFVDQLLAHFSKRENKYPMQPFIGKTIGIVGDGDGGKIAASLLARVAPPEAYGYSSIQLGGPENIKWFGIDCLSQAAYAAVARSRYLNLKSYFPRRTGVPAFIQPFREKATEMTHTSSGGILLKGQFRTSAVDIVVIAAGYERNASVFGVNNYNVIYREDKNRSRTYPAYSQISGENVYKVGACAQVPILESERPRNSVEVPENSVSTWLTGRRTELAADFIARDIREILRRSR